MQSGVIRHGSRPGPRPETARYYPRGRCETVLQREAPSRGADSGSISVSGVDGATELTAGSGNISAKDIGGRLKADADSGTITARNVGGAAKLIAGSGDVTADGIRGDLDVDADSGAIEGKNLAGKEAVAQTGAGDVVLTFAAPPDRVDVNADSGSARLRLPGGLYAVNASVDSGKRTVEVPTDPGARQKVKVEVGAGDAELLPQ